MRDYAVFLADIVEAMTKIQRYTEDLTFNDFTANDLVADAVARNLEVIGEASRNVPEEIKNRHPEIPWSRMIGLRNLVIHEYFGRIILLSDHAKMMGSSSIGGLFYCDGDGDRRGASLNPVPERRAASDELRLGL